MEDAHQPPIAAAAAGAGGGGSAGLSSSSSSLLSPPIPRSSRDRQCLTWSRVAVVGGSRSQAPPPRSGAASVVVKGRLYVFGGYGGGTGRLDDFYSFNFETGSWEEVQVLSVEKPGCRENNGVVISDSSRSIYLFGGYNGNSWLNDLWKFDIESKQWTCIQDSSDYNNTQQQNQNQQVGGRNEDVVPNAAAVGDSSNKQNNQVGHHNHHGPVKGKVPSRRFGYVSVVHEGKFVLFGGFDGSRWLNDMYVFDFATKTWTEITARGALPTARSCPAWAKDDTHVYIQGGYDGVERKADFFACDLETYTWTEMPCLGTPPSPRYFHSCCLYGNKMYLYGGYSGNERLADMYAYDFETNHWSQVDCTSGDAPSGRSSLVAQVYENCLYIFGGYNGSTVLNDFYKFRLKPIGVPPPGLVSDFRKLINNDELADVCFSVEGKEVYAHRAVLAIRSEYFRVMLCGGMRESFVRKQQQQESSAGDAPIELPDVSHSVFLKVLEFLYTDTVRDVSLEVGIHLLIASEQFMLDRLKALCADMIRRDINVENVVSILVASHRHNASGLKDITLEFILRNLNDPTVMAGLSDLRAEPDLLLEIIKRNTGISSSQAAVSSAASQGGVGGVNGIGGVAQGGNNNTGNNTHGYSGPFGSGSEWGGRR